MHMNKKHNSYTTYVMKVQVEAEDIQEVGAQFCLCLANQWIYFTFAADPMVKLGYCMHLLSFCHGKLGTHPLPMTQKSNWAAN